MANEADERSALLQNGGPTDEGEVLTPISPWPLGRPADGTISIH